MPPPDPQWLLMQIMRRPARAAYVVAPGHLTQQTVCSLTHHALSKWGGRYHLMAPCDGQTIAPAWLGMLRALDPDYLFFVGEVSKSLIDDVHDAVYPAAMRRLEINPNQAFETIHTDLATVHAVPRWVASRSIDQEPVRFADFRAPFSCAPDLFDPVARAFCALNFGLADEDEFYRASLAKQPVRTGEYIRDLFPTFATFVMDSYGPLITRKTRASVLSRMPFTPHGRSDRFTFVVGDSPLDMAYAWNLDAFLGWNREFPQPLSQAAGSSVMWLPTQMLASDDLVKIVVRLALRLPRALAPLQSIRVCSMSMSEEEMKSVCAKIGDMLPDSSEVVVEAPECLSPDSPHFPEVTPFGSVTRDWTHRPLFFQRRAVVDLPAFAMATDLQFKGRWACDIALQRHLDDHVKQSVPPIWTFPQRSGVENEMVYEGHDPVRINAEGLPVRILDAEATSVRVAIPSVSATFRQLSTQRRLVRDDLGISLQTGAFQGVKSSTQGQHFDALLDLFGGFSSLRRFMIDRPWSDVITAMVGHASVQKPLTLAETLIAEQIEPAFADGPLDEEKRHALAKDITKSINTPLTEPHIEHRHLFQIMRRFGQETFERQGDKVNLKQLNAWARDACWPIDFLLNRGVLFRGFVLRCAQCGLTQWIDKTKLAEELACKGCRAVLRLSHEGIIWSYKLNELVVRAYRERGILSTIAALEALGAPWHTDLPFRVGVELVPPGTSEALKEIDIMAIDGTALVLGEVKSDPSMFRGQEMREFHAVAARLQASRIFFASPRGRKEHWERAAGVVAALNELKATNGGPTASMLSLDGESLLQAPASDGDEVAGVDEDLTDA